MGIVFSSCFNVKDPPARSVNNSIPQNNSCFTNVIQQATSSGLTSRSNSGTPIFGREISTDRIIDTIIRLTNAPVAVSIPDRTREVEKVSSSEGTSNSRVTEHHVAVLVPEEINQVSPVQEPNVSPSLCIEKLSLPNIYNVLNEECLSPDEEDVCPTCYEEYNTENPKITTECSHEFHLSCIYAWMERSSTCPICSRVMVFNEAA